MKKSLLVLVLGLFSVSFCFGADAPRGVDVAYFDKLRFDFAARKDYVPMWDTNKERKAVVEAFKASDYAKTKELGEAWLKTTPVDAEIQLLVAFSLRGLGDVAGYTRGMAQFYGLLASITSTGDGLTPQTAFKVISVSEEYFLLRDLGAKVKKQSLANGCDVMVVDQRGKEITYYFDVRSVLQAEARAIGVK